MSENDIKRPLIGPMSCFIAAILAAIFGVLVCLRALPFLREDTILSGGKLHPTGPWAAAMAKFFWCGSAAFVLLGVIGLLILSDANRRYIAQLPRRKRFLIWPWGLR